MYVLVCFHPPRAVLSRVDMSHLCFNIYICRPLYAVLDECTSAVSVDAEIGLYTTANKLGITCITISQRLALPQFHFQELRLGPQADDDDAMVEASGTRLLRACMHADDTLNHDGGGGDDDDINDACDSENCAAGDFCVLQQQATCGLCAQSNHNHRGSNHNRARAPPPPHGHYYHHHHQQRKKLMQVPLITSVWLAFECSLASERVCN